MQPKAEVKITHGKESMTKSGKIFSIFQLLQTVDGWINVEGEVVPFQPLELFRVRRGQRGAMSVELELGDDRFVPLGIGEDKQSIVVVDPITGSTLLMNWSRTSIEEQAKGLGDSTDTGADRLLNVLTGAGPVVTEWNNGELKARITFDSPKDLEALSKLGEGEDVATKIFGCLAHNIESLREPNALDLDVNLLLKWVVEPNSGTYVLISGDSHTIFRLDLEAKDMFACSKHKKDVAEELLTTHPHIHFTIGGVTRLQAWNAGKREFNFEHGSTTFYAHSKQEESEIVELLGESGLGNIISNILLNEVSTLAKKWLTRYMVRVITSPAHYADKILVERVRANDQAEGRGDIYHVGSRGEISLDRSRARFEDFEGPMFSLEDLHFADTGMFAHEPRPFGSRRGSSLSDRPRRAEVEVQVEHVERHERPGKIPTREWIPQMNQCVYIEDDPKQEMYYIADYDQADHKFLLVSADSLRRERLSRQAPSHGAKDQPLHHLNGQIPVEPGRLRPFVLFH
jgi:hypothetical protein